MGMLFKSAQTAILGEDHAGKIIVNAKSSVPVPNPVATNAARQRPAAHERTGVGAGMSRGGVGGGARGGAVSRPPRGQGPSGRANRLRMKPLGGEPLWNIASHPHPPGGGGGLQPKTSQSLCKNQSITPP